MLLKNKLTYLLLVLYYQSSKRSTALLKVRFKHHPAVAIGTEDFSLHELLLNHFQLIIAQIARFLLKDCIKRTAAYLEICEEDPN